MGHVSSLIGRMEAVIIICIFGRMIAIISIQKIIIELRFMWPLLDKL